MRGKWLACAAVAALAAGCGAPDETTTGGGGGTSSTWIQTGIAGADIDGDGRVDVVTIAVQQPSQGASDGFLKIYRQTAPGVFTATQIQVGRHPWRVQIADVNGDGAPDLLVLDIVGGTAPNDDVLYLLLQKPNSRGSFQSARAVATGLSANDFVVADANLDLAPDLLVAGVPGGGTGVAQYLGDPVNRGTFAAPTTIALDGRVSMLALGDYALTGRRDLIAYSVLDTSPAANAPGELTVAFSTLLANTANSPAFYLTPPRVLTSQAGVAAAAMATGDVDADGLTDVVVGFTALSSAFQPKITTVLQRALGQVLVVDTPLTALSGLDAFVVADLTGDGRPDVATTGVFTASGSTTTRSRVNILVPTGVGLYAPIAAIDMPVAMSRINAADVNGDGLNDILLLGDSNRAFVMFQSSTAPGTFAPPRQL